MDIAPIAKILWNASNVWMEFRNKNLSRSSLYKAGETLVSKTQDTKGRDSYAFMRLPVQGDPVIHLFKGKSGWQISGLSSVLRKYGVRKDPESGQDLYVIRLQGYNNIPTVNLDSIVWEIDSDIRIEIAERKKMRLPAYYPFVQKREVRSQIVPAERYLSLTTRTIIHTLLSELGGKWKEWGIDPEFSKPGAEARDIRDVLEGASGGDENPTQVNQLIDARRGQGRFRANLDKLWDGKCAVTGLTTREMLKASHIKPWSVSSNKERLNPENGILLSANLDVLFDSFMISFSDNGSIIISEKVAIEDRKILQLEDFRLSKPPSKAMKTFLRFHRKKASRI